MFVLMRSCSLVVLSYLNAGFETRCGCKGPSDRLLTACLLLLLLAKMCCSALDPKRWCKTPTG